MLSGGERALTAVALLFAMLEVRPVPFCVLDEVDAALDEANIGRFADALRSLADQTQFIVITHNRGHDRGGRRAVRRDRRRRLGVAGHQPSARRGAGAGAERRGELERGGLMPFWRRRREEPKPEPGPSVPSRPGRVEPTRRQPAGPGAREPSSQLDSRRSARAEPPPPRSRAGARPAPAYAPFDPTAFLAVAPAHTLDQGLEKTRGAFMTQLRGYLGGADGPAWDEVEETLIAGDVGAALAIDLVERARAGAATLTAPEARDPRRARRPARRRATSTGRRGRRPTAGPPSCSSSASTAPARRRRSASSPPAIAARGARSSSPPPTRSAPPPSTSSGSGPTAPASRSSPMRRAPTRVRSSTTRSTPPSPGARTSSSPTPPAASTPSRTSWTS